MTEAELLELWQERAAIIEEGCSSDLLWKLQTPEWRRHEAERLAYWDVRKRHPDCQIPRECYRKIVRV